MRQLSPDRFEAARRFMFSVARPLEFSIFRFRFEGGQPEAVIESLASFSNRDGGFGRALEPDVRTPTSSALATSWGLQVLQGLDAPADHSLVRQAVDWTIRHLDADTLTWRVVPTDVNDHPHAPWWHDADGSLERAFDNFRIIPRALLVSLLYHFRAPMPPDVLDRLTEETVRAIEETEVLGQGGGSDLEYVLRLAETTAVPTAARQRLLPRILATIPTVVEMDATKWSSYCVTPLKAAPHPGSPGADRLRPALDNHLDHLIDAQTSAGSWDPSWDFDYPPAWAQAHDEWRGVLTLEALTTLQRFERLAVPAAS